MALFLPHLPPHGEDNISFAVGTELREYFSVSMASLASKRRLTVKLAVLGYHSASLWVCRWMAAANEWLRILQSTCKKGEAVISASAGSVQEAGQRVGHRLMAGAPVVDKSLDKWVCILRAVGFSLAKCFCFASCREGLLIVLKKESYKKNLWKIREGQNLN